MISDLPEFISRRRASTYWWIWKKGGPERSLEGGPPERKKTKVFHGL